MVRLADIARETGYSIFTVSCALRDRSQLAPETRRIIKEAAARMGYKGNAAASLLALQKQKVQSDQSQIRIGWIGSDEKSSKFMGFRRACDELGYDGEKVDSFAYESPRSMIRVLWNRGFSGVVLSHFRAGWDEDAWLKADWSRLSAVKNLRGFPGLSFHLVRHSAFDYMLYTLDEVWRRGYRRIAILVASSVSDIDDNARLGALLAFREQIPADEGIVEFRRLPVYSGSGGLDAETLDWLKRFQPDVIIGFPFTWIKAVRKSGFAVPKDVAFASPLSSAFLEKEPRVSGCDPQMETLEYRAVCLLHTLIQTGEKGMVESSLQDVIVPRWVDCGTLPVRRKTRILISD